MADYIRPELLRLIAILESWAEDQIPPVDKFSGICVNLVRHPGFYMRGVEALVSEAAKAWPEYSGHPRYPVPHPDLRPETAYTAKLRVEKWSGEYGESRRRLCQHVADWIRENPLRAEQISTWR